MGYWQNGVTPMNEDNMNKLMVHRGTVSNTNFNQITEPGIYYLDSRNMTNAPTNYKFHYLEVLHSSGVVVQKIFTPSVNELSIREYSGDPASWGNWKTFYANERGVIDAGVGSGSSEGTRYWKLADGTLMITGYKNFTLGFTETASWANGYSSGKLSLPDFPVTFTSRPNITGGVLKTSTQWGSFWTGFFDDITTTNPGKIEFIRATSTPADVATYQFTYIAIGRWF